MLLDFEYVISVLLDFESLKFKLCFLKKREGRTRERQNDQERERRRRRERERERMSGKGKGGKGVVSGGKGKVGTKDGSKKQPTTRSAKAGLQFPGEEEEEEETHTRAPLCDFFSFFFF